MPTLQRVKRYGWKRDRLDHRDKYLPTAVTRVPLPPTADLRTTGFMPPVYDQGQLGCHDEKTEVLTSDGWTPWSSYDGRALLGTMNRQTHSLEFQSPIAIQRYDYHGPLHVADHRSLDYAVTPNHRMFQRSWNESARTLSPEFTFREISDIGWYAGLPASTSGWTGTTFDHLTIGTVSTVGDDMVALLALILSDGWVGGTENNINTLSFCCFRDDRRDMVAALAARLDIHEVPGRCGVWKFSSEDFAAWARTNLFISDCYRAPFKKVPDLVKCASQEQVELFLRFYGDQHVNKDGSRQFYTSSHVMAGDIQELLLKAGGRPGIYERESRSTTMKDGRVISADNCTADITVTEWRKQELSLQRKDNCGTTHYSGNVFCATVPNGTLITRRNGAILISGNSCTANAIAGAIDFTRKKQGEPFLTPSRLFIYFGERVIEGTTDQDSGAEIRDGIKVVASQGVPPESEWPYVESQYATLPPANDYRDALAHKALQYSRVTQAEYFVKHCIAILGRPVVFGFTVFDALESDEVARTGILPVPDPNDSPIGGHAVVACGYDDRQRTFLIRNSWGSSWGQSGYFMMPYAYLLNGSLADDFWTILLEQ